MRTGIAPVATVLIIVGAAAAIGFARVVGGPTRTQGAEATQAAGDHTYAAESPESAMSRIPLLHADTIGPPGHAHTYRAYPVGADPQFPAYLIRVADGSTCLTVQGSDGVGAACRRWDPRRGNGTIELGEFRADGSYLLTMLVPDGVTTVTAGRQVARCERNLVRLILAPGAHRLLVASQRGDFTVDVDVSEPPRMRALTRPRGADRTT